jgi:hypothetical protein
MKLRVDDRLFFTLFFYIIIIIIIIIMFFMNVFSDEKQSAFMFLLVT